MSKEVEKDFSANPEIEQLLSAETCNSTLNTCVRIQPDERLSMNELYVQGSVSSLRSFQDEYVTLNHNAHIDEISSDSTAVITSSLININENENNDDPPPYAAIPPPYSVITPLNQSDLPYRLFSFGDSYFTDETRRMEIPLTPFQTCLTASAFHPEGINGQYASYSMPLTSYRFFKFGCHRNFLRETADEELTEKINDKKLRRRGVILMAAAVIIFVMVLSLMVRFVTEKSWWRR